MSEGPDYRILMSPGLTEKEIAEVLRRGPSEAFLRHLAMMLDPLPIAWRTPEQTGPVVYGTHDDHGNIVWDDKPSSPKKRPTHKQTRYRLKLENSVARRQKGQTKVDMVALGCALLDLENSSLSRGAKKPAREDILRAFGVSSGTAKEARRAEIERRETFSWLQSKEAKIRG